MRGDMLWSWREVARRGCVVEGGSARRTCGAGRENRVEARGGTGQGGGETRVACGGGTECDRERGQFGGRRG